MKKRRFGLVINFGIEYRNFLLSGLASELKRLGEVVVLRRDFDSPYLDEYLDEYKVPEIRIPRDWFSGSRLSIEGYFSASRRARKRLLGVGNFHNYKEVPKGSPMDFLKGNRLSHALLSRAVERGISDHYFHKEMCQLIKDENITDVFVGGYSSVGVMKWARNAAVAGVNSWIIVNSWKDLFVNDFVPFPPTGLFVWSEAMKADFLRLNSRLKSDSVFPAGNPIFDRFFDYKPIKSLEHYAKKYEFDVKRPIVIYSLINPVAYDREHLIVRAIDQQLDEVFEDGNRPLLVLRRNPFEVDLDTPKLFEGLENCVLADQYWERDENLDVSVQSQEGEEEWTDLLYYSKASIHIASTVALESLLFRKPVVNVGFGPDGRLDEACLRYAQAPFYLDLIGRPDVIVAESLGQCIDRLTNIFQEHLVGDSPPEIAGDVKGKCIEKIRELI